jgi:hypothetical protein
MKAVVISSKDLGDRWDACWHLHYQKHKENVAALSDRLPGDRLRRLAEEIPASKEAMDVVGRGSQKHGKKIPARWTRNELALYIILAVPGMVARHQTTLAESDMLSNLLQRITRVLTADKKEEQI